MTSPEFNYFDEPLEHRYAPAAGPETIDTPELDAQYWREKIYIEARSLQLQVALLSDDFTDGILIDENEAINLELLPLGEHVVSAADCTFTFIYVAMKDIGYDLKVIKGDDSFYCVDVKGENRDKIKGFFKAIYDKSGYDTIVNATSGLLISAAEPHLTEETEGMEFDGGERIRSFMTRYATSDKVQHNAHFGAADGEDPKLSEAEIVFIEKYKQGYRPYNFEQLSGIAHSLVNEVIQDNPQIAPSLQANTKAESGQDS